MKIAVAPIRMHNDPRSMGHKTLTHRMGTLNGETASQWFGGSPPPFYTAAAQSAAQLGYSVPYNAQVALAGAEVWYVNPDGTVGQLINWQTWPLRVVTDANNWTAEVFGAGQQPVNCAGGGCLLDTSWVSPPSSDIWFDYMTQLGVASIAQIQAAATAAAAAYAAAAAGSAAPGLNPSQYGTQGSGSTGSASTTPAATAGSSAGQLVFSTSRGGTALKVGDSWTVSITNAAPNSPVSVYGVHPDGTTGTATMGTTSANGSFSTSGTFDSTTLGNWSENWMVNGVSVGSFAFSVSAPGTSSTGGGSGSTGSGSTAGSGSSGAGASASGGTDFMSFLSGATIINGVPNMVLIGGGILALLLAAK